MPQTPKHATPNAPANGVILVLDRIWHREGPLTAADLRDLNAISEAISDMRTALDNLSEICAEEVHDLEKSGAQDPSKATRVVQARQSLARFNDLTRERIDPELIDVATLREEVDGPNPAP